MGKAPDVGNLECEALGQLAPDGKIERVRVWGLDSVVQAPGYGESPRVQGAREGLRKFARRRREKDLLWNPAVGRAAEVGCRYGVHIRQTMRACSRLDAGWI